MLLRIVGALTVLLVIAIIATVLFGAITSIQRAHDNCEARGLTYYEHAYGGFCIDRDGRLYGL